MIGWRWRRKTLYDLVKDAWLWKVYLEVSQRRDLEGLHGSDHRVVLQARAKIRTARAGFYFSAAGWHLRGTLPAHEV